MRSSEARVLRIFISSTFMDMQRERDILGRLVLPRLRHRSAEAGVTLREVDLRWGVTELMQKDVGTVTICLNGVAACSPYVFGMVGHRAGWTPPDADVRAYADRYGSAFPPAAALTELEMRHAVDQSAAAAAPRMPILVRSRRLSESLGLAETLDGTDRDRFERFRAWIAECPEVEALAYDDFDQFERLSEAALAHLADHFASAPPAPRAQVARDATFEVARPQELRRLRGRPVRRWPFFIRDRSRRPLLVWGRPGSGSSWLARRFGAEFERALHLDGRTMTIGRMAAAMEAFCADHDAGGAEDGGGDEARRIAAAVMRLSAGGGSAAVVVDHFDEIGPTRAHADLSWFPTCVARDVSLIVLTASERLRDQAEDLGWEVVRLSPMARSDAARLAVEYLRDYSKHLTEVQAAMIAEAPWAQSLTSLTLALDELRRHGSVETLDDRIRALYACPDETAMIDEIVTGIAATLPAPWDGCVPGLVAAIAISLRGLLPEEIRAVAGELAGRPGEAMPIHYWEALRLTLGWIFNDHDGLIDLRQGSPEHWVAMRQERDPVLAARAAAAFGAAMRGFDPDRRLIETPRLAMAREGLPAVEELFGDAAFAAELAAVDIGYLEAWLSKLEPEALARVSARLLGSAGADAEPPPGMRAVAAAMIGLGEEGWASLAGLAGGETGDRPDVRRSHAARDARAMARLLSDVVQAGPDGADPEHLTYVVGAVAEGWLAVEDEDRLLETARRAQGLDADPHLAMSLRIGVGQIHIRRERWRDALRELEAAEALARRTGASEFLCRSLERRCAVELELGRFKRARTSGRECLELARSAGRRQLEALAFERLIEVETRRAQWTEAYELAAEYLARCRDGVARVSRAKAAFDRIEAGL